MSDPKTVKGRYGVAEYHGDVMKKGRRLYFYDVKVPSEVGDYTYYWRIIKEENGYSAHQHNYIKLPKTLQSKYDAILPTLKKAVQYADIVSYGITCEAVESLKKMFKK